MVAELQQELAATTQQSLAMQADLQRLQFSLHQLAEQAEARAQAEGQERDRLAAELGQVRAAPPLGDGARGGPRGEGGGEGGAGGANMTDLVQHAAG